MKSFLREQLAESIAFARVALGMSRGEFMQQTPRAWQLLQKAWEENEARADRRTARICATIAWGAGNTHLTEEDFMPRSANDTREQTAEEIEAVFDSIGRTKDFQHAR